MAAETVYLTCDDAIFLHQDVIRRMGSAPAPLVHPEKLDSALARP